MINEREAKKVKFWKIKWENIISIFYGIAFIFCIISHIKKNGFDMTAVGLEVIFYSLLIFGMYVAMFYLRKDILSKEK